MEWLPLCPETPLQHAEQCLSRCLGGMEGWQLCSATTSAVHCQTAAQGTQTRGDLQSSCRCYLQKRKRAGSTGQGGTPWCFKRHLTSNFLATDWSNRHTGVICNIGGLISATLHIIVVVKALLQCQPPVDCSVCDETWSHCLQMPLMVSNLRTKRIIFLGCPACSTSSYLGEAALQAAWNVFLRE